MTQDEANGVQAAGLSQERAQDPEASVLHLLKAMK